MGFATAVGAALSVVAVSVGRGLLAPEVSSSLGFAVAGLLGGLFAYSRSHPADSRVRYDEDDEPGQETGAGMAWVPEEPRPRRALGRRTREILRLAPVGAVALGSLVGAAILAPQALPINLRLFPPDRRAGVFAVYGAVAGIAVVVGPTLGGFLVTNFGWPSIFYVNLPIGVAVLIASFLVIPDLRSSGTHRLDC